MKDPRRDLAPARPAYSPPSAPRSWGARTVLLTSGEFGGMAANDGAGPGAGRWPRAAPAYSRSSAVQQVRPYRVQNLHLIILDYWHALREGRHRRTGRTRLWRKATRITTCEGP